MGFVTRTLRKVMYATSTYVDPKKSVLLELGDQNAFNNLTEPEDLEPYRIKSIMEGFFKKFSKNIKKMKSKIKILSYTYV